ncbi:MAG: hypothetical protein EA424_26675 [Planctomycetaceae bacterium]|nr:MAG: hypothetical protein EA424_26675 [Planctomycetaceae bacterium]
MTLSLKQFSDRLDASGVLSRAGVQALLETLPTERRPNDGQQLARLLVKQKQLTAYQAQEIYAGKGQSLTLGNYVILDKLGQGGMGMVLKAEHRRMERVVALKVLSPAVTKTPEALARFQREVKAAAKLEHPHIVIAHDADEAGGTHFLVMQYVEGTDLSVLVREKGPRSVEQAVSCVLQAARGLEYAHARGVVHRDIKPANLLLDRDGNVKVLDMGLARLESAGADQHQLTGTGQIMGTIDYMPPEQALDTKHADARADIYALGVTLWFLLTGRNVYGGDSVMAKLLAHRESPIPSLASACPAASPKLEKVFARMVAKKPEDRYQSMCEVIADLQPCQGGATTAPSVATAPGDESRLNAFLGGLERSAGQRVATKAVTKKQAAPATGFDPTVTLQSAQVGTDPETQHSMVSPLAAAPAKRRRPKSVWWQIRRVRLAKGAGALLLLVLSAAIVFFVQTSEGTIRVEINDPSIEVAIQGTEILLRQADQGKDVKLSPGDKTLIVQRGDFTFETDKLILKKGETITVRVELLEGKVEVKQRDAVLGQAQLPLPPVAKAPFDTAQAKAHQEAWAKHFGVERVKPNSLGMQMILIPPGEFLMGSSDEDVTLALKIAEETNLDQGGVQRIQDERPQHLVRITKPFRLGMHEVTIGQFGKFIEQSGYKTQAEEFGGNSDVTKADDPRLNPANMKLNWYTPGQEVGENSPVTQVSWNDAVAFCNWLSEQEKFTPSYVRDGASWELVAQPQGYRLPTEAEWEYACRAGTTTQFWFGDDWKEHDKFGWSNKNAGGRPRAAGLLPANPFGLHDMHGNVWEWCHDWYDGQWYARSLIDDPKGPLRASLRAARGGSWSSTPAYGRSSSRDNGHTPAYRHNRGFRMAF